MQVLTLLDAPPAEGYCSAGPNALRRTRMKNVIRVYCTLFLLTTSAAFSQATPDATSQNAGSAATPAMANMSDPATETSLQKMETELSQAAAAHDTAPFTKYLDDNI